MIIEGASSVMQVAYATEILTVLFNIAILNHSIVHTVTHLMLEKFPIV